MKLVFANTVFHKIAIQIILEAEFTESVVGALQGNAEQRKSIQFMHISYRATFSG